MNSIQIFAADHRKNVDWNLPYIRLGNFQSDAALNIKYDEEIAPLQLLLSEGAQIWYVYKNYAQFGSPEYVGFCHYRRFFSFAIDKPLVNISQQSFDSRYCAQPFDVLNVMLKNNLDDAAIIPFQVTSDSEHEFVDIAQQIKYLSKRDELHIPDSIIDRAFGLLLSKCSKAMKPSLQNAMLSKKTYVCNMFIMNKKHFFEYADDVFYVFKQLFNEMTKEELDQIHPRFMGYILERFTSLYLTAFASTGSKIGVFPVLTVDAQIHKKWDASTKGDYYDELSRKEA